MVILWNTTESDSLMRVDSLLHVESLSVHSLSWWNIMDEIPTGFVLTSGSLVHWWLYSYSMTRFHLSCFSEINWHLLVINELTPAFVRTMALSFLRLFIRSFTILIQYGEVVCACVIFSCIVIVMSMYLNIWWRLGHLLPVTQTYSSFALNSLIHRSKKIENWSPVAVQLVIYSCVFAPSYSILLTRTLLLVVNSSFQGLSTWLFVHICFLV